MENKEVILFNNILNQDKIMKFIKDMLSCSAFIGLLWLGVGLVLFSMANTVLNAYLIFEDMPNIAIGLLRGMNFFLMVLMATGILIAIFYTLSAIRKSSIKNKIKQAKKEFDEEILGFIVSNLIKNTKHKKDVRRKRTTTRKSR